MPPRPAWSERYPLPPTIQAGSARSGMVRCLEDRGPMENPSATATLAAALFRLNGKPVEPGQWAKVAERGTVLESPSHS
jgi:hypothetical protein